MKVDSLAFIEGTHQTLILDDPLGATNSGLNGYAIAAIVVTFIVMIALTALTVVVIKKKDNQALKIKSPLLLIIFMCANIVSVVLLCLVYLNAEVCQDPTG